jgi:peptidoglycan/LPS O-acetylase OafA/YrhL
LLALAVLGTGALAIDFRGRIVVAFAVALALIWLQRSRWASRLPQPRWVQQLGERSYSIFLIHFAVCLLANALVTQLWPGQLLANALGMLAAFGLSLVAGAALYHWVESPHARWRNLWKARLIAQ